jgi:dipeptidyl-peptidase-4
MRPRHARALVLLVGLLLPACASVPDRAAPAAEGELLTLERLHETADLTPEGFGPARWLEGGSGYTTLEPSQGGLPGRDVVRYDPGTGAREVLVPAARLVPHEGAAPLEIADYHWSPGRTHLLVFTNTARVWRLNTRGDYWLLDLESWALRQLGEGFEPSTLMFAKFSPDGGRVAYVHANDLYVEDVAGGERVRLTRDGSETIINGTFDWVYEEEFHLRDGFRWSPDGERIAYWQLDAEGVGIFHLIDNLAGIYSEVIPIQYPKVGTTNSACRVGVVPAAGGETVWVDLEGDPRQNYVARVQWTPDSTEVLLQYLDRRQQDLQVVLADPKTGAARTLFVEHDDAWVDVVDDLRWLPDGARFTWVSERDGWRHVWLVERAGGDPSLVTPWDHDVVEVVSIDVDGGWLYYIASPEDPTQRFLYRSRLDGSGTPERLTPDGVGGTHAYQMSPDTRWALRTSSSFEQPPVVDLVRLPEHETARVLVDNAAMRAAYEQLARTPVEFFRVDVGDGVELDGWCMKPPGFDPSRRWPVVFHVYGEPWGQTVLDRWGGGNSLWHLMLTQRGYVVMSVDNRGTPAPRGREWRKCIYGQIGILASRDQAEAVRAIQARWDWVDPERTAIWGWSGGGSMTLNALLRYPELYEVGLSIAPVPDQRLYDTIYQERYMGLPEDNPEGYRLGSPLTFADGLEGDLLLIHGTADDNVHYQGSEKLIDAFIAANKPFTMMAYPGRSHSIHEGEGTRRHLFELLTRYLEEHLPAGPRP